MTRTIRLVSTIILIGLSETNTIGYYRMRLANALLGIVETEAMLAEDASASTEAMLHAHQQALRSAGAMDAPRWASSADEIQRPAHGPRHP